ncbi:MAG: hypothetical protein A2X56_13265 [Nitrospirae bacterium GWC2_57_13]|jgi:hypothetical protein|nr:MAG: hypothetical protein A2X56_13265 [Nitrospirae bacterium GWC2_57_13]OGW42474.1 MAG: hypothetical protein A2X57_07025 [Nitrospirae bacterium GWD2_57_8]HAR46037.1 hypothetical protein [Nitrospiraceae bacterium]HAS53998.1 hypothetical protein [Nitrospiraceae bacterium]
MSFPPSGDLRDAPLPELFEGLHRQRFTGVLSISAGAIEKSVFLKDGEIVFARSTDGQDRIGEILIRDKKLTRANLETALQLVHRAGGFKKLGAVLVENGFVVPKDLFTGLKTQVKEIIYSLFLLEDGRYRVDQTLPVDIIHLQINIEELILEIIQRIRQEA